ncbi:MAG: ATP-binding cassette domain-containing protein [Spirochaetales bacterium]|nr:ATP-binding cassette domain-containing protein [Spirochaetales bacterium]
MSELLYSIRNLKYAYPQNEEVVLDIDRLDLESGKVHVLLGPNGSGKTTFLKILNRLIEYNQGEITFMRESLKQNKVARQKTVYVHQNPLLFSATVYDNVAYGLRIRKAGPKNISSLVKKTLSVVGLEGFEKRRSQALSAGEKQRVAIARALIIKPDVLFLDEPTASVDKANVARIEGLLTAIKTEYGCTIIVSTHNIPFAYRVCDSILHLEEGKTAEPLENIFKGELIVNDEQFIQFDSGKFHFYCPYLEGDFKTAVIDYDRIFLSSAPVETSARNNVQGTISKIETAYNNENLVIVEMDVGEKIKSCITKKSLKEMRLCIGGRVYLHFKASAVRLY